MLTIRREQLAAFSATAGRRFRKRMAGFLRRQFAEETRALDEDLLLGRVRDDVMTAASFGIAVERDIALFLILGVMYGERFIDRREHAWIKDYLTDPDVPEPGERMNRVFQAVVKKFEEEAGNRQAIESYRAASRSEQT